MNENRTLARPYAKAIFELAKEAAQLEDWSRALKLLAETALRPEMQALYQDPEVSPQMRAEIFDAVLQKAQASHQKVYASLQNLIALLAEYRRLKLLPMIAELFEEDKACLEKMIQVQVTSASPVSEKMRGALEKALAKRFNCAVNLAFDVDVDLLGGAIIRAGDWVIDGSVRSKLLNLRQTLMA